MASYCEQYYNPPGLHPSEPNYLWLEAGTNFGILDNKDPVINHQNTTNHLVAQLRNAGDSWKTYQEDIEGNYVPLFHTNLYTPHHNPFLYFDDVTGTNDVNYAYGIAHIRPYSEFESDLTNDTVARYNFIVPNLCNGGHTSCSPLSDPVSQSDNWLASEVPEILASQAYLNNGALFITWDEGTDDSDGPIGMIVISPLARGGGYFNHIRYTHSSFLRTMQEIFGVTPWLGDAANATSLVDLFSQFSFGGISQTDAGDIELLAVGIIPGKTNIIETSENLVDWSPLSTNVVSTNCFTFKSTNMPAATAHFYRLMQLP